MNILPLIQTKSDGQILLQRLASDLVMVYVINTRAAISDSYLELKMPMSCAIHILSYYE